MNRPIPAALATLFAPLVVAAIYLFFSRWPERWFTEGTDLIALIVAILIGLGGLWALPLKQGHRALAALVYVPVMLALLLAFWFLFVCSMFEDCL